jgi:ATP-dependent DNA helicase RecG
MHSLTNLFADVSVIPQVGETTRAALHRLNCYLVIDLLWHLPYNVIIKQYMPNILTVEDGANVILKVQIQSVDESRSNNSSYNRRRPFRIHCSTDTGFINLVYFNYYPQYIVNNLKHGDFRIVAGKLERFNRETQIVHPEYCVPLDKQYKVPKCEIIYPLTYGIVSRQVASFVEYAIRQLPKLPEWINNELMNQYGWPSFDAAIKFCHHPSCYNDLLPSTAARTRLAYDELLATQLALALIRKYRNKTPGYKIESDGVLIGRLLDRLGFNLTAGQEAVVATIKRDQASEHRMMRLLQGDVGSGKTVVALIAMLNAVAAGKQATLMAPTDILANQHKDLIEKLLSPLGVRVELLTGKIKGKKREELLDSLQQGKVDVLIGTHALFQESVLFADLGMIVIDEQHRFGVEQRLSLIEKGNKADILVMTATPIPRSLTLTAYGDMDCSSLTEKPVGRKPIQTSVIPLKNESELVNSIIKSINEGKKIYWICPLIDEQDPEKSQYEFDIAAAISRYNQFQAMLPGQVGLIHGRIKPVDKEQIMQDFASSKIKLLVATTVIEVGIDVPDASIIVIEQAERFGLAQLHQLRGRVGRGNIDSYCVLLYGFPISAIGKAKLKIMRETNDGFRIAEEDLLLRGAGDILGTRQTGFAKFKFCDFQAHSKLLQVARQDIEFITNNDPQLQTERGQNLRTLLHLFGHHDHIRLLTAG